jgi:hypothetical protein
VVDDVDSDRAAFLPFVEQSVSLIGDLIQNTEDINIANELLSIISVFAVQLESAVGVNVVHFVNKVQILPFAQSILTRLNSLWTKSANDDEGASSMLKTGILRCLKKLVQALGM